MLLAAKARSRAVQCVVEQPEMTRGARNRVSRAGNAPGCAACHPPHVFIARFHAMAPYLLLTLTEGDESYLRVVDLCAESIARAQESRKLKGGQPAKHQWRRRGQRSGGADETQ